MKIRRLINKIHLVIGLLSGSIILIIAVTGALFAFEEEIRALYESDLWYVNSKTEQKVLDVSTLKNIADLEIKKVEPVIGAIQYEGVVFYNDPGRTFSFIYYNSDPLLYREIIVDPYSGNVLSNKNYLTDFFFIILELHRNLMLGSVGKEIIDYASLIFLFMLISGIYLWWPRNKNNKRQRFRIKFRLNPKRTNYDLHNVLGFYISWIAVIVVLTGFSWAFSWFNPVVDWVANGGSLSPPKKEFTSDTLTTQANNLSVQNNIFSYTKHKGRKYERFLLIYPKTKTDVYKLIQYYSVKTYYKHEHASFDQYSGKLLLQEKYENTTTGDKVTAMAYDIHIGKIFGLPGQILVFLSSIIAASLPITGFRIWLFRRKKKNNSKFTLSKPHWFLIMLERIKNKIN